MHNFFVKYALWLAYHLVLSNHKLFILMIKISTDEKGNRKKEDKFIMPHTNTINYTKGK